MRSCLGLLEALGLAAAPLAHGTLGRVQVLVAGDAADARGLGGRGLGLFLLEGVTFHDRERTPCAQPPKRCWSASTLAT